MRPAQINRAITVCPANVRSVWAAEFGEIARWWPKGQDIYYGEYRGDDDLPEFDGRFQWLITNHEFIRKGRRLEPLKKWAKIGRTMLIDDESWAHSNPIAAQTKAMWQLRDVCERRVLLNGTPGPLHKLYAQFQILDPNILKCKNWWQFKARFVKMGGWSQKEIVGYHNVDEFQRLTADYAVTRLTSDCWDVTVPVRTTVDVQLTEKTWKIYREMKRDCVAWLDAHTHAAAPSAGVAVMRLAQIVNGFVGGAAFHPGSDVPITAWQDNVPISAEKILAVIDFLKENWTKDRPVLIFARFQPDIRALVLALQSHFTDVPVSTLYGESTDEERARSKAFLDPHGPKAPAFVVANAQSGGVGLDCSAAEFCLFVANDFSLKNREQAEARITGPNQDRVPTYVDFIASGPQGQKTIDHDILAALRADEDVATWTAETWRRKLA